jgi:uncharacterized protein (DUF1697 family)
MPQHVAFLRAINVGGRQATRDQLCSCLEELGFSDVATFRASGNVIFAATPEPAARMKARIEEGLAAALGFEVVVFLRSAAQVNAIAKHKAFDPKLIVGPTGKLQVALLPAKPPARARDQALALATDQDRLAIKGSELYWLPSGGTQKSELDVKALEKLVGPWTMRTIGTIEQIATKHFAH